MRFRIGRWRWLAVIGVLAVALTATGLILLARHWPFSRQRVIDALQDDFHATVTFSSFHETFFPHPGCVAEGAALVRPGAAAGPNPFVSAQKFIIRAHYLDFLRRPGYVSHVELQGLQIHVPPRGSMPAAALPDQNPSSTRVGEVVANNALLEIARKAAKPLRFDLHGTLKTDAEFSKVGGGGIKSVLLKPFDAIFKKKPKGAEIPVKLTGTYAQPQPSLEITGGKKSEKEKK